MSRQAATPALILNSKSPPTHRAPQPKLQGNRVPENKSSPDDRERSEDELCRAFCFGEYESKDDHNQNKRRYGNDLEPAR